MTRWMIATGLAFAMAGFAQFSDTTPPVLVAFDFSPKSINVTAGPQSVTVTMRVTDNLSGVTELGEPVAVWFYSPSRGQSQPMFGWQFTRISGGPLDGTWRGSVEIPRYCESGNWTLDSVVVRDAAGNRLYLSTANLRALGFPTDLAVTSNPDTSAPVLTGISMSPAAIDVSAGPRTITVRLTVTDNLSGANLRISPWVWVTIFRSPSGKQESFVRELDFTLVSGTGLSGTWEATARFPQFSEPGTWVISFIAVTDNVRNSRWYGTNTLRSMGLMTDLSVTSSPADITPPLVTAVSFVPSLINTSERARTVTALLNITDDLSGTDFGPDHPTASYLHGVQFRSPSGQQIRDSGIFWSGDAGALIAGTRTNGLWQLTVNFPQYSEAGTWKASLVGIKDTVHNWVSLSTADLVLRGFPSELEVIRPSLVPDGSVSPAGGTVRDQTFGDRAQVIVPPNALTAPSTSIAIDVFSDPLQVPMPTGFQAPGSYYVNIHLGLRPHEKVL